MLSCVLLYADDPTTIAQTSLRITTAADDPREVQVTLSLPQATAEQIRQARQSFKLQLIEASQPEVKLGPAIFATTRATDNQTVVLIPRFRLTPGATYQASAVVGRRVMLTQFQVEDIAAPQPIVVAVRPTGAVPANCLKFYVYFSQPMREGKEIFDKVRIVDELGAPVVDPWRRVELWSSDAKRLTLWIHPGRIKRGVNLREEFGPVLQPNRKYQLVVDATVRSALGAELGKDYRQPFETTTEDHEQPNPAQWKLKLPLRAADWLEVRLDEPLDHAQLLRFVSLYRHGAKVVELQQDVSADNLFLLKPKDGWQSGAYELRVNKRLEDLAGNTPERVFDRDLAAPGLANPKPLVRRFHVGLRQ